MLFALFAASGFAGLIYESIWTHYLKLFLGHAAYAQTLVLAIFMGGLALGSWLSSRWSRKWRDLLVAYAVTEAAIGLLALVFHEAFTAATGLAFDAVLPRLARSPCASGRAVTGGGAEARRGPARVPRGRADHRRFLVHLRGGLDPDALARARLLDALLRADAERVHPRPGAGRPLDPAPHRSAGQPGARPRHPAGRDGHRRAG